MLPLRGGIGGFMKNSTKQVVVLDNCSSPYIYQAILFLKDYNPAMEDKILAEAEKVVAGYFQRTQPDPPARGKKNIIPWLISGISLLTSLAVCFFFRA